MHFWRLKLFLVLLLISVFGGIRVKTRYDVVPAYSVKLSRKNP